MWVIYNIIEKIELQVMNKTGIIFAIIVVFSFIVFAIKPISKASLENSTLVVSKINSISLNEITKDIYIDLENDNKTYYINRGLEKDLVFEKLMEIGLNNPLQVYYAKHWTPLDPLSKTRHISRIITKGNTIYSEFH